MSDLLPVDPLSSARLRIARPTDRMRDVVTFYTNALGFSVLGKFEDHDGFDGVMLGHKESGYHLEFTTKRGEISGVAPSREHLLVFYLPDDGQWRETIDRIESIGLSPVKSFNPYWDRRGRTYEDPDGYRVVIHNTWWQTEN